jgi:hypothetical protein
MDDREFTESARLGIASLGDPANVGALNTGNTGRSVSDDVGSAQQRLSSINEYNERVDALNTVNTFNNIRTGLAAFGNLMTGTTPQGLVGLGTSIAAGVRHNNTAAAELEGLRSELGITDTDLAEPGETTTSLGVDRSAAAALNEGEMSQAARDAAGGYGSGNREEDNVRRTTTTPATEPTNPTNPTGPTTPGDATLPTDDLLDNAWQRFYAYQGAGGGTYNTNYYQRGPYAIRNETLGSDRNPPDYFSLF